MGLLNYFGSSYTCRIQVKTEYLNGLIEYAWFDGVSTGLLVVVFMISDLIIHIH